MGNTNIGISQLKEDTPTLSTGGVNIGVSQYEEPETPPVGDTPKRRMLMGAGI